MKLEERIEALLVLKKWLLESPEDLAAAKVQAKLHNQWFSPENIELAFASITEHFLNETSLREWLSAYPKLAHTSRKKIGIVMAGNIPLVGFHDLLCVFLAGHQAMIKLSSKDEKLLPALLKGWSKSVPAINDSIELLPKLKGFEAVIATGSNNTARYFEQYFSKVPYLIRKGRQSVAVLTGEETKDDFLALGKDVFNYFGLGCRNVSKLYLPKGYDFEPMMEVWHEQFKELMHHNKYKNNFDYNFAMIILNKIKYISNGCIILTENEALHSGIGCLHYAFYEDVKTLSVELTSQLQDLQCIVSKGTLPNHQVVLPGYTQKPGLADYADGVDTMAFLETLKEGH